MSPSRAGLMIGWFLLIGVSLAWNLYVSWETQRDLAFQGARSFFQQVDLTRSWNSTLGGVYAPLSERLQPNPYLDVEHRDITATTGKRLTLVNPAYMTRQISELAWERSKIQFHLTSLKPLRPANQPNDWETTALRKFDDGVKEVGEFLPTASGTLILSYMAPLVTEKSCLQCHAKQGYREGNIRGGISLQLPIPAWTPDWELCLSHLLIGCAGIFGIHRYGSRIDRYQENILAANQLLEEKNSQMNLDLEMAEEVQKRILAGCRAPAFLEIATLYLPQSHVSGDVYQYWTSSDNVFHAFLGDGTGHGVAAALISVLATVGLQEKLEESDPVEVLKYLNQILAKSIPEDRFMSAILLKLEPGGALVSVNAGHPPPIVVPADGRTPLHLRQTGPLLGLSSEFYRPAEPHRHQLKAGDLVFLYTDGLTEWSNPSQKRFGEENLATFLSAAAQNDPTSLLEALLAEVRRFSHGIGPADDISMVAMKYRGLPEDQATPAQLGSNPKDAR